MSACLACNGASWPGWPRRRSASGGTIAASHQGLTRTLAHDKGNVSTSLKGLEAKGRVIITRTPGGLAEAVDLTTEGRKRVAEER